MRKFRVTSTRGGRLAALAALGFAAQAEAAFQLTPFASAREEYDDNVLRNSSAATQSEHITTLGAGANLIYSAGLQSFSLDGSANQTRYSRIKESDYDGSDIGAGWNWQLGSRLGGDLRLGRSRGLQDFATRDNSALTERSITTTTTGSGSVKLAVLQKYEIKSIASANRRRNSDADQQVQDLDEASYGLVLSRVGPAVTIGLQAQRGTGEYIERQAEAGVIDEFQQSSYQVVGTWRPSGITSLNYAAGWSKRENEGVGVEDEDSFIGSLGIARSVSVKTSLRAGVSRDLSSSEQQGESTVVSSTFSTGANWAALSTISVNGDYYYTKSEFKGATAEDRDRGDAYQGASVSLTYAPRPWLALTPAVNWADRVSDEDGGDFENYRFSLELKMSYPLVR